MSKISPLAYIDKDAQIGENCEIGPFCFIDKNVVIGDNNVLMNNVSIHYGARIGNGNTFFPGAVISGIPQDLKFHGEERRVGAFRLEFVGNGPTRALARGAERALHL